MDGILNHSKSGKFMDFLHFSLQPLYRVWYIGLLFPQSNEIFMKKNRLKIAMIAPTIFRDIAFY